LFLRLGQTLDNALRQKVFPLAQNLFSAEKNTILFLQSVDSLLNAETVKLYNGEQFEINNYHSLIKAYQDKEYVSLASLNLLNTVQSVIISAGLFF
jgi:ABC-type transport system involved in Fe-S cluster assembly fused permease/ATPase subunit